MKDAIVVLAGGIDNDGLLPAIPKARVSEGVRRYRNGESKIIIMTGKYGFWLDESGNIPPRSESAAMKEYAISLGVPPGDILIEDESKDTIGNALFTLLNILIPNGLKDIIVVTSDFHIKRSKYIFDLVLGPEYAIEYVGVDSDLSTAKLASLQARENITLLVLREYLGTNIIPGDTTAVYNWLLTKHPGYATKSKISYQQLRELLGRSD